MKKILVSMIALCAITIAYAQDASILDTILNKDKADYMDFAFFVASEAGIEGTMFELYVWCDQFQAFPFKKSPDSFITPKQFSYFMMKLYSLPGGVMWSTLKNQRYAWKELKATNFWDKKTNPNKSMSGRELTRAISKFYTQYDDIVIKQKSAPNTDTQKIMDLLNSFGGEQ